MHDPKIKGSLNEMEYGTQINLVILNMMAPFILNLKIHLSSFKPNLVPKINKFSKVNEISNT